MTVDDQFTSVKSEQLHLFPRAETSSVRVGPLVLLADKIFAVPAFDAPDLMAVPLMLLKCPLFPWTWIVCFVWCNTQSAFVASMEERFSFLIVEGEPLGKGIWLPSPSFISTCTFTRSEQLWIEKMLMNILVWNLWTLEVLSLFDRHRSTFHFLCLWVLNNESRCLWMIDDNIIIMVNDGELNIVWVLALVIGVELVFTIFATPVCFGGSLESEESSINVILV